MDKKRSRFKQDILSQKDAWLSMHVIDSFGKKKLWRFQNCKDIICECHRTNATGETKMKFQKVNCHEWFIIDRYVKNTLRIDSKQRLPCFCRYYGVNLEKSLRCNDLIFGFFLTQTWWRKQSDLSTQIIFLEKLNICYLTESLLIENIWSSSKVNYFIWLLFWFLWKCCLLNAR